MNRLVLLALLASTPFTTSAQAGKSLQASVEKSLRSPAFEHVHATETDGVVTLTGTVDLLKAKLGAEARVAQVHGVRSVEDNVQVADPRVSDPVLQQTLQQQVHTRAVSVEVRNGMATLRGHSVDPVIAWAAVSKAASTPGVQGIVDNITVSNESGTGLGPMPYTISSVP